MNDPSQNAKQPQHTNTSARRRGLWVGGIIGGGLVVLLTLGLLLPTFLSTAPGRRIVMSYLSTTIAGTLDAERLSLAWFSGQSARGVTLADPQGNRVAMIRQLDAPDVRLLPFLLGSPRYGHVVVDASDIHVRQQAGQPTNLELALQSPTPEPDEPTEVDPDLNVRLDFTADRITYDSPDVERVELTQVDVGLDIPDLRRIAARVRSNLVHADQPGRIDLTVNLTDAFTADGQPQPGQATIQSQGQLDNFPLAMLDGLMGQEGRLAALLGDQLGATFTATGPLRALEADIRAQSPRMTANLQLVGDEQAIRATEGSQLQLQITPPAFAAWMTPAVPGETPPAQLLQPFTVNVQLAELILPRGVETEMDLASASLNLEASADDIMLDMPDTEPITLGQPRLTLQSPRLAEQVTMSLQTQATVADVSEPVSAQLVARHVLNDEQPLEATLEATALPVALMDIIAGQDGRLALTIGQTLTTTLHLQRTPAGDITFAGDVEAPRLTGPFEGGYTADGAISLRTPEPLVMQLSPQAYARWTATEHESPRLTLEDEAELSVNIEQLDLAMLDDLQAPAEAPADDAADQPMRLDPERTRVTASVASPMLRIRDQTTNEQFTIEQGRISLQGQDLRQLLEIDLDAVIDQFRDELNGPPQPPQPGAQQQPGATATGRVQSQTRIQGLLSQTGEMQPAMAHIQSDTTLDRVPSIVLDTLARQGGNLVALLGPRTSAEAHIDYRGEAGGTVDFDLQSDNATARLPGRISADRVFHLREDATASLNVTPEMGRTMLATINPFLNAISGERPVTLVIRQENFAMPLDDFDLTRANANAQLDLGTLRLQQGPLARSLFGVLSAVGGRFDPGQTYDAQFTPTSLELRQGTLRYDDLSMQFAGITLGFRGQVNYGDQRFNLTMLLPAASLGRVASGLERAVGPDYQLQVPVTGTFDEPRLDSAAMTRELTQLALRAGMREAVGDEAGGLLDIITGRPRQQPQEAPDEEQPEEDAEPEQRDPVRDIFDLFRQRNNR